jgi:predicted nicotinamide N-methyase
MITTTTHLNIKINTLKDDAEIDPNFFDESYTIATSTASNVWESSVIFIDYISSKQGHLVRNIISGRNVLELGSGTGVTGIALASLGSTVLLTDVECVVPSLVNNITLNATSTLNHDQKSLNDCEWTAIGTGHARAQTLDWTREIKRYPIDPFDFQVIVATDTTWLRDLSLSFIQTLDTLLKTPTTPTSNAQPIQLTPDLTFSKVCCWVYKERGRQDSTQFANLPFLQDHFQKHELNLLQVSRMHYNDGDVYIYLVYP